MARPHSLLTPDVTLLCGVRFAELESSLRFDFLEKKKFCAAGFHFQDNRLQNASSV